MLGALHAFVFEYLLLTKQPRWALNVTSTSCLCARAAFMKPVTSACLNGVLRVVPRDDVADALELQLLPARLIEHRGVLLGEAHSDLGLGRGDRHQGGQERGDGEDQSVSHRAPNLATPPRVAARSRFVAFVAGMTKLAEQRAGLPDQPGVYLFRDARGRVIYVGKAKSIRKRVASHFSARGHAERVHRPHRVRRRRDRGRGAAGGAELHPPVQAALQHPPARRQVLSLHRDLARRGLPAGLLHARAPPPRARLLRPLLVGQARARHARPARQDLPLPLLRGAGAGAALGLALPRLLHQALRGALRRLRLQGGVPRRASTA